MQRFLKYKSFDYTIIMKIRTIFSILLVGVMMLSALPVQAQTVRASKRFAGNGPAMRVTNTKQRNKIYHGLVLTTGAVYFSGDVIRPGELFKYLAFTDNLGASVMLNYKLTFNPYVSMRFGAQYCYLQGSNKKISVAHATHEFKSSVFSPFVGVEVYPVLNYGFFIYGGFGFANSFFMDYKHQRTSDPPVYTLADTDKKVGFVPMFQFGLGYNWWLDSNWTLGIELLGQIGLCKDGREDANSTNFSIDGWPYKDAYNFDRPGQKDAYDNASLPDGWLQLGMVVSYHF